MHTEDIASELKTLLSGAVKVSSYVYCARCPVCGDSKKKRSKKRFYVLVKKGIVYCHNCGYSNSIRNFAREYFPEIKSSVLDASVESIRKTVSKRVEEYKPAEQKPKNCSWFEKAAAYYGMSREVPEVVSDFLKRRRLESRDHGELWYIEDFAGLASFCMSVSDGKPALKQRGFDPRVFIPFFDGDGKMYAAQGRALYDSQSPKYLTAMSDSSVAKVYNLFGVDRKSRVYVLEGPIDSMFVPNSVATSGSNCVEAVSSALIDSDLVYVFDRDFSYNWNVRSAMKRALSAGGSVFVHPPEFCGCKDVNDYVVKTGASPSEVASMIDRNSFKGVVAAARMAAFRSKEGDGRKQVSRHSASRRSLRS